ncbi:glycosyltransferase [Nocardioides sp.]|uniref:glycosyltransferase n=1 Tax=Nocardioides sp. TaxID=35761 RepID=UPI00261D1BC3|nr:glycosyltransferase [Nocardioides sp.]
MVKRALFAALLLKLRFGRVSVVRTLHNETPHESGGALEVRLLQWLDGRVAHYIALNPFTRAPRSAVPTTVIAHGHYRGRYPAVSRDSIKPGRILYAGMIRDYKGLDILLHEFVALAHDDLSLRIVGNPTTSGWRRTIEDACRDDDRISAHLGFVPDADLAKEIGEAEVLVLPYRTMHNSGILMLALSLDRCVVVPRTPVNEWLAAEAGPQWVRCFDPPFKMSVVLDVMRDRGRYEGSSPRLTGRDWDTVAMRHATVYREALSGH